MARWHPDCNFESFSDFTYSLSIKPEASSINETENEDISDSCLSFDRIKLSNESSFANNMMHFCLKLQEKYILPHSTNISIMEDIITLFSEFHHLVLTNAQSQFNQNNQFYNESDLLEKNYLTKIWDKLKHETQFEKYMETLRYVHPTKKKFEEDSYQYISLLSILEQYLLHDDVRKAVFHFPNVHQSDSQNLLSSYTDRCYFQHHNESKFRLRTSLMHELHLQAIEQDRSLIRAYGVVSKCSLSDLVGFSPATAFPPDIMHDCSEGVIPVFLHYLFNDLAQKKHMYIYNSK